MGRHAARISRVAGGGRREAEDRFHAAGAKLPAPLRELERAAARFPQAITDTRRYGMAKCFMTAAHEDGVDLADEEALDAWFEGFNARPFDERLAFLGPLPKRIRIWRPRRSSTTRA